MKFKFLILISLFIVSFLPSCKKGYLDINQNPNNATDASITTNLILPRALTSIAARTSTSYDFAGRWCGYWTRSGTYGPSTEEESYNITTGFGAAQWSGWYDVLFDLNTLEKKANAGGQGYYAAIAKVMKTIGFMYLVDMYNNVPYSKAFDLGANITPAYDNGQDIYNNLLNELDAALVLINGSTAAANPNLSTADVMFGGNMTNWKKLINTQRLKMLLRQSQIPSYNPAAQIAKITTDGFIGSGQTASISPGYLLDNGKQSPFWDTYKLKYNNVVADDYNRANNYILNTFKNTNDIRYQYFFSAAQTPLGGNTYYGYNYGENIPNTAPQAANSSAVSGPGLARSATQRQWFFTSVESMFLQAEAMQRTWLTGNAQTMYENAVRESFIWLGVPSATTVANTYLTSGNSIVDWATASNKINLITMQKYLALCGVNNFEAWVDYRRLGVPTNLPLSLSPGRGANVIPVRLRYPQAEYNTNSVNATAQGNPSPFTSGVFWDK